MVPVSPIYTAYEIEYIIKDAEIKTVICLDTNFGYVREVMPKTDLQRVIVTDLVEFVSLWKRVIGYLFDKIPKGKIGRGKEVFFFKSLISEYWTIPPELKIDPWKDLAYIMYTGGTTGFPKGVPGNHMGEVSYIRDIMDDVIGQDINEGGGCGPHGQSPLSHHGQGVSMMPSASISETPSCSCLRRRLIPSSLPLNGTWFAGCWASRPSTA